MKTRVQTVNLPPVIVAAINTLNTCNSAVTTLISALTAQGTARFVNEEGCDYCGEKYQDSAGKWVHDCPVILDAEKIMLNAVNELLKERAVAKNAINAFFMDRDNRIVIGPGTNKKFFRGK